MSEKGRKVLLSAHPEAAGKIEVIPHGIPDRPFLETHAAKAKFGFGGKTVILTFGLLSPNKGIETVIDAMPGIIESCPSAVYVVLGATHPNLLRDQGEAYRERLMLQGARARRRRPRRFSQPVRRAGHAARLHLDVRCLCDALPQRSPDDVGHARLQLRARKGRRFDPLLARQGALERRARHPGSVRGFQSHRQRDRRPSGGRCPPQVHARARLRCEPIDDLGADGGELPHGFRERAGERRSRDIAQGRSGHRRFGRGAACDTPASGNSDRAFPLALRQHRHAAARRVFGGGPLARILRRRQRPRPAPFDGARSERRDAIVRDAHGALCVVHPARVESGHRPLPQFHELRPPMAGAVGLGG